MNTKLFSSLIPLIPIMFFITKTGHHETSQEKAVKEAEDVSICQEWEDGIKENEAKKQLDGNIIYKYYKHCTYGDNIIHK